MQEIKLEKILASLDGMNRANAPVFFYEKIRNRLRQPENGVLYKLGLFIARPMTSLSFIFFILLLNIILLESDVNQKSDEIKDTDYSVSSNSDFDELIFGYSMNNEYVYN